ncbi:MAG: zeta toxin family protein [Candidatus Saccharibacteria bacterium]|nr:zeta toxin family protein [Rhodoferax sp.]
MPIFHLLAGPNGAGKSSLYRALLAENVIDEKLEFVNADIYERDHLKRIKNPLNRSEAARNWAEDRRSALLQSNISFVSETVFSHPSKIELIERAKQAGYQIVLYIVAVDNPETLAQRVNNRVREGGHGVPTEKILSRYPRTLANLTKALPLADVAFLYDSQDVQQSGLQHVATCRQGVLIEGMDDFPAWVKLVLAT